MPTPSYIIDVAYRSTFNPLQSPARLGLVAGLAKRPAPAGSFSYLEIGCGPGATLCVLADAYPQSTFVGVDFNPEHIQTARALAAAGGLTNLAFIEADISDIDQVATGQWDFIICTGLFSWLERSLQDVLLAFAGASLTTTGLLYVHYASLPGAAQAEVLHQALRLCVREGDNSRQRLSAAARRLVSLSDEGAAFFHSNPLARARLVGVVEGDAGDEAHEALAQGAGPNWFAEIAQRTSALSMSPIGCVAGLRAFDPVDSNLDETLNDLRIDRSVRHDVFSRTGGEGAGGPVWPRAWYVTPLGRSAQGAQRLASSADLSLADASAVMDRVFQHATTSADMDAVLKAARLGLVVPMVSGNRVAKGAGLSAFNSLALRMSLAHDAAPPLSAPAIGAQLILPLEDRVRLFALTGGDITSVFAEIDQRRGRQASSQENERRTRLGAALNESGLEEFRQRALPELSKLGVL